MIHHSNDDKYNETRFEYDGRKHDNIIFWLNGDFGDDGVMMVLRVMTAHAWQYDIAQCDEAM